MLAVPPWLKAVRALRPAHVVAALAKGSELLLLSPLELRRVGAAPRLTVPEPFLIAPLLRAARDAGSVIGLVKPGALLGEGSQAQPFARAVAGAAEEIGFGGPFFLATSPLPFPPADRTGEHLRAEIQRYLDAGFTQIVLDASRMPPESAPALGVALEAVRERELPVTLAGPDEAAILSLLAELRRWGLGVELVKLEAAVEPGHAAALIARLGKVGLELPLGAARIEGLSGVDLSAPFAKLAARASTSPEERERLEALVYGEALALLGADPWRGSALRTLHALVDSREG